MSIILGLVPRSYDSFSIVKRGDKMAERWKPKDPEIYKEWIIKLLEGGQSLSDWECDFIVSIVRYLKLKEGNNLSQAQAEKLENIYATKTK
jgi:hypothetical protein